MNDARHRDSTKVSDLDVTREIDALCSEFDAAWRAGQVPKIEEYLNRRRVAPAARLLRELLAVELDYRRGREDTLGTGDYVERFPAHAETIQRVFDVGQSSHDSTQPLDGRTAETPYPIADVPGRPVLKTERLPRRFGDYELIEEIDHGGMGVVYKARRLWLDRIVALKMIRSGEFASEEEVARFFAEAESAAKLNHPHIVPIYNVGECDGRQFFSMAFVEGHSLAARLQQGPLPPGEAARLLRTNAEAVQYAHDNGVVHRDLKPSNVLIDSSGQPMVLDFGLAKRIDVDSGITQSGQILGTPGYMPPEQAGGDSAAIGPASDVYSLGANLYAFLTGRPPFQAANVMETLNQVQHSDPVPPRQLNPDVPADLETICLRCLEKEQSKRYKSAADLAADVQRWLNGEPIHARPATRTERLIKWAKRKPAVASALAASIIAVFALGGLLIGAIYNSRLQDSLQETETAKQATETALGDVRTAQQETENALAAEKKALAAEKTANRRARRVEYYRRIALAREAWENGHIPHFKTLLDGAPEEFRHWEWHYLSGLMQRHLLRHRAGGIPYGPDPMTLIAGGRKAVVRTAGPLLLRVIDLESGKELRNWKLGENHGRLLFTSNGKRAASFRYGGKEIHLWDVERGKRLWRFTLDGQADADTLLADAQMTRKGDRIVVLGRKAGRGKATLLHIDVATGQLVQTRRIDDALYSKYGNYLAVDPDGRQLAVRSHRAEFLVVDAATGKVARKIHTVRREGGLGRPLFQPSGDHLATVHNNVVQLWKTDSWTYAGDFKHQSRITCLQFHPTKNQLITGCRDRMVRIWDIDSGRLIRTIRGNVAPLRDVGVTTDGQFLWSLDKHGYLHKWAENETSQQYREVTVPFHCRRIRLSADGGTILAGGRQRDLGSKPVMAVIDREKAKIVTTIPAGDVNRAFDISADGRRVVSGRWDQPIAIRDAATGELIGRMNDKFPGLKTLALTPNGRYVIGAYYAAGGEHGRVAVWDVAAEKLKYQRKLSGNVWNVVCHPGGKYFLVTSSSIEKGVNLLTAFHTETGKILFQDRMTSRGSGLAFAPRGNLFAVGRVDQKIDLRSFPGNRRVRKFSSNQVTAGHLAFSPDGKRLAGPLPGGFSVWDVENGVRVLTLKHPTRTCVAFTRDGFLMSGGHDGTIRIWDGRLEH